MSVVDPERLSYSPFPLRPGGRWWLRARLVLLARWRATELDRQLAEGVSPRASALLEVRAGWLTSRRYRTSIASGLARASRDGQATPHAFTAAIPPNHLEVIDARTLLATLDCRLRGAESVTAQGVALLASLLTEGDSPLYRPTEPGALGSRLRAAAAALDPHPGGRPATQESLS